MSEARVRPLGPVDVGAELHPAEDAELRHERALA
jgi:hypothetical protein